MQAILKAHRSFGKLLFKDQELFNRVLASMPEEFEVLLRPERKDRSGNQNRYYWGVVLRLLADHSGHSEDEVHEILKATFLTTSVVRLGKHEHKLFKSTTDLSTVEMEEYLAKVRMWASQELQVFIPLPNEVHVD